MFEDWSEDVSSNYDGGGEPAGHINTQAVVVPSRQHLKLYRLLRSTARVDQAGRLVSWWPQAKLAARLEVSVRTLQRLLADLREPGPDPRHPKRAPGLRLGLVRVEPTRYRDQATGRHRLGGNLYVLTAGQHATLAAPSAAGQVNTTASQVSCLNKGENHKPVSEEVPHPHARDPLDVGRQQPLERLDYDPTRGEVLATLEAGLGQVEVLAERRNDQPPGPPTYTSARGRLLELAGSLADFHRAVDQLDRDTCMDSGCQPGQPCRRHTRRNRARG